MMSWSDEGLKNVRRIRWVNDTRYIHSEIIQLPFILTMWKLLGNKLLLGRVGDSKIEEWLKGGVTTKR